MFNLCSKKKSKVVIVNVVVIGLFLCGCVHVECATSGTPLTEEDRNAIHGSYVGLGAKNKQLTHHSIFIADNKIDCYPHGFHLGKHTDEKNKMYFFKSFFTSHPNEKLVVTTDGSLKVYNGEKIEHIYYKVSDTIHDYPPVNLPEEELDAITNDDDFKKLLEKYIPESHSLLPVKLQPDFGHKLTKKDRKAIQGSYIQIQRGIIYYRDFEFNKSDADNITSSPDVYKFYPIKYKDVNGTYFFKCASKCCQNRKLVVAKDGSLIMYNKNGTLYYVYYKVSNDVGDYPPSQTFNEKPNEKLRENLIEEYFQNKKFANVIRTLEEYLPETHIRQKVKLQSPIDDE